MKRAIISVSDKTGIVDFSKKLEALGFEIISTGGTLKALAEAGIKVKSVTDVTKFPECLDGRVKTLHPGILAGVLAMKDNEEHVKQLEELEIDFVDMVVVNLYPFKETILKDNVTLEEAIENIDIGGPTMLRAAAKNYKSVTVITDPLDYSLVLEEIENNNVVSEKTNMYLATKVFIHTSSYDTLIAEYLKKQTKMDTFTDSLTLTFEKVYDMRYGENPHQKAAFYKEVKKSEGMLTDIEQLNGKELSFNNINDTHGALELLKEFDEPTIVACKHSNPCGVSSSDNIFDAYIKAHAADPISIFGGIVVSNREIDLKTADEMKKTFLEIILAPSFTDEALNSLKEKKNLRVLRLKNIETKQPKTSVDIKKVSGGMIVQEIDSEIFQDELNFVTDRKPTKQEMEDLEFMWKVVKYVKSNGIAVGQDKMSFGIGAGQVSRIWATNQAIDHAIENLGGKALEGAVLASDAFFPFGDCVEAAHKAGITAIIQPGGSVRDNESIELCNKYNIAMVFTGMRHFRH